MLRNTRLTTLLARLFSSSPSPAMVTFYVQLQVSSQTRIPITAKEGTVLA